jgi:predicted small lipoprotein YifL
MVSDTYVRKQKTPQQKSIMSMCRFPLRSMMALVLLLFLAGCSQGTPLQQKIATKTTTPQPVATTYPYSIPTLIPSQDAPHLGAVPTNCPVGPHPVSPDPQQFGPGIGSSPVWALGFAEQHATLHLDVDGGQYTSAGWQRKILWVVHARFPQTITLQGKALHGNASLLFQLGDNNITAMPLLDPRHPGTITGQDAGWSEFPSYLYVPAAGCYVLEAHWHGGGWTIPFAAGL